MKPYQQRAELPPLGRSQWGQEAMLLFIQDPHSRQGQKVTAESLVSDTFLNAPNAVVVTGLNDGTAALVG